MRANTKNNANVMHLTPKELAARWGMSVQTLAHMRVRGAGPRYLKIGNRVRYPLDEVCHWEVAMKRASTSER